MRFCFFFFGNDLTMPEQMVRSIKRFHHDAEILQLTNQSTPAVAGVTSVVRAAFDESEPMFARSALYASVVESGEPVCFLDADMLLVRPFPGGEFLNPQVVYLCERYFNRSSLVNTRFAGLNLCEHEGKTLHEAWPYLGCFIVTASVFGLLQIHEIYKNLPSKLRRWYGDQEALRIFAARNPTRVSYVSER